MEHSKANSRNAEFFYQAKSTNNHAFNNLQKICAYCLGKYNLEDEAMNKMLNEWELTIAYY